MFRGILLLIGLLALPLALCLPAQAAAPDAAPGTLCSSGRLAPVVCIRPDHAAHDICQAIRDSAGAHGLDSGFFARLLWQESRFDANALSPAKARGIAQFIDSTARLRGLGDSYNPAEAIDRSAHYLAELVARYGSLGMAAVAYNGGEFRAEELLRGENRLRQETRDYVRIITGLSAEDWLAEPLPAPDLRLNGDEDFLAACHALARDRRITPLEVEPRLLPWGVQLAFGITKGAARDKFAARTRSCRGEIGGKTPDLVWDKSRASPKGGYWMARLGAPTRDAARALCTKLSARGCRCMVTKNPV